MLSSPRRRAGPGRGMMGGGGGGWIPWIEPCVYQTLGQGLAQGLRSTTSSSLPLVAPSKAKLAQVMDFGPSSSSSFSCTRELATTTTTIDPPPPPPRWMVLTDGHYSILAVVMVLVLLRPDSPAAFDDPPVITAPTAPTPPFGRPPIHQQEEEEEAPVRPATSTTNHHHQQVSRGCVVKVHDWRLQWLTDHLIARASLPPRVLLPHSSVHNPRQVHQQQQQQQQQQQHQLILLIQGQVQVLGGHGLAISTRILDVHQALTVRRALLAWSTTTTNNNNNNNNTTGGDQKEEEEEEVDHPALMPLGNVQALLLQPPTSHRDDDDWAALCSGLVDETTTTAAAPTAHHGNDQHPPRPAGGPTVAAAPREDRTHGPPPDEPSVKTLGDVPALFQARDDLAQLCAEYNHKEEEPPRAAVSSAPSSLAAPRPEKNPARTVPATNPAPAPVLPAPPPDNDNQDDDDEEEEEERFRYGIDQVLLASTPVSPETGEAAEPEEGSHSGRPRPDATTLFPPPPPPADDDDDQDRAVMQTQQQDRAVMETQQQDGMDGQGPSTKGPAPPSRAAGDDDDDDDDDNVGILEDLEDAITTTWAVEDQEAEPELFPLQTQGPALDTKEVPRVLGNDEMDGASSPRKRPRTEVSEDICPLETGAQRSPLASGEMARKAALYLEGADSPFGRRRPLAAVARSGSVAWGGDSIRAWLAQSTAPQAAMAAGTHHRMDTTTRPDVSAGISTTSPAGRPGFLVVGDDIRQWLASSSSTGSSSSSSWPATTSSRALAAS